MTLTPRVRLWLRIAASAALLGLCVVLVDTAVSFRTLAEIHWGYFLAAFALNAVGTILIRAWVAHLTTGASGLLLSFSELIRINLAARFYTIVLPRGASAAFRWHRYRQAGSGHAAAALLMFENLVSIFTLFLSAAVILSVEWRQAGGLSQVLLPVAWLGVVVSVGLLLPFVHGASAGLARRFLRPLLRGPGRLSGLVERLLAAVADYQAIPRRRIGMIVFASVLGYLFFVLSAWVLAQGMALEISLAAIAWIRSLTLLLALVPVTVAGIGLREGAFIVLLRDYGVAPAAGFAFAIALFAIQLMLGIMGAVLEAFRFLSGGRKPADPSCGGAS